MALGVFSAEAPRGYGCVPAEILEEIVAVRDVNEPDQQGTSTPESLLTDLVQVLHKKGTCRSIDTYEGTADQILDSAAAALRDRAACRDIAGERSMARCIKAFNALTGQDLSEFQGWLFMGVLKYARATAGNPQLDDLIDAAGYSALAGESIFHKAEMQTMSGVMDTP